MEIIKNKELLNKLIKKYSHQSYFVVTAKSMRLIDENGIMKLKDALLINKRDYTGRVKEVQVCFPIIFPDGKETQLIVILPYIFHEYGDNAYNELKIQYKVMKKGARALAVISSI